MLKSNGMNMKTAQITLKLFLDALGIPPKISTLNDRKKVQKAVYIGQKAGVDLGYSYGWYLLGPYSPELTQDYFTLNNDLATGNVDYENYKLVESSTIKLSAIKSMMETPSEVKLSQEDWLELVASIIYKNEEKDDIEFTRNLLRQEKTHLIDYFDVALKKLNEHGFA